MVQHRLHTCDNTSLHSHPTTGTAQRCRHDAAIWSNASTVENHRGEARAPERPFELLTALLRKQPLLNRNRHPPRAARRVMPRSAQLDPRECCIATSRTYVAAAEAAKECFINSTTTSK